MYKSVASLFELFTQIVSFHISVLVDLTEPESGDVIDGKEATFTDLQFTTNQAKVELQWRNFEDPESLIKQYEVLVESAKWVTSFMNEKYILK